MKTRALMLALLMTVLGGCGGGDPKLGIYVVQADHRSPRPNTGLRRAQADEEALVPAGYGLEPFCSRRPVGRSPDGSRVLALRGRELYLRRADTARLHRVAGRVSDAAWSPDGQSFLFVRLARVYVADAEARHRVKLAIGHDPAWSPDGRWIAFSKVGDIWIVRADGTERAQLTRAPAFYLDHCPVWLENGRAIAFSRDVDVALP